MKLSEIRVIFCNLGRPVIPNGGDGDGMSSEGPTPYEGPTTYEGSSEPWGIIRDCDTL